MSNDPKELLRQLRDGSTENNERFLPPAGKEDKSSLGVGDVHIMPAGFPELTSKKKGFDLVIFLVFICIIFFLFFKHK